MKLRPIKFNIKELLAIRRIYIDAFPINERPPFPMVLYKQLRKDVDFLVVDNDGPIGLAYCLKGEGFSYLFFFAMREDVRNKGYGSKVLALLDDRYGNKPLMIALEQLEEGNEELELRIRRRGFYQRNGFEMMDFVVKEGPVTYDSMCKNGKVSKEEYLKVFDAYFNGFDMWLFKALRWGE